MLRTMRATVTVAVAALVVVALSAVTAASIASANPGKSTVNKDLAAARAATAKYHNIENALADGFVSTELCVEVPGLGAMGIHYINMDRIMDPALNPDEPEVLLYAPHANGYRLIGAEWLFAIGGPDEPVPSDPPPAPELFGQVFDGPMLGHGPGEPPHYDLHVWLWKNNPEGMFAQFNPSVSCGDTTPQA